MIKMSDTVMEVGEDDGGEREREQQMWHRIKNRLTSLLSYFSSCFIDIHNSRMLNTF